MALNAVDWCALVKSQSCQAIITIRCSHKLWLNVCVTNVRKAVAHLVDAVAQQCDFYSTCQYYMRTVSSQCYKPKRNETSRTFALASRTLRNCVVFPTFILFICIYSNNNLCHSICVRCSHTHCTFISRENWWHFSFCLSLLSFTLLFRCCFFFHFILHIYFTLINVSISWCTWESV